MKNIITSAHLSLHLVNFTSALEYNDLLKFDNSASKRIGGTVVFGE